MPLLRRFIAGQIERLEVLREEAWEAVDGPEAESVAAKALMDAGKEAQVRHRYYRDAQLAQQRAIKLVMTLQDRRRRDHVEPTPRKAGGAEIMERMVKQMAAEAEAEARAEGRAEASANPARRNEANEATDRAADDRRNSEEKKELRDESSGEAGPVPRRTEPRPTGAPPAPIGPGTGSREAFETPKSA